MRFSSIFTIENFRAFLNAHPERKYGFNPDASEYEIYPLTDFLRSLGDNSATFYYDYADFKGRTYDAPAWASRFVQEFDEDEESVSTEKVLAILAAVEQLELAEVAWMRPLPVPLFWPAAPVQLLQAGINHNKPAKGRNAWKARPCPTCGSTMSQHGDCFNCRKQAEYARAGR